MTETLTGPQLLDIRRMIVAVSAPHDARRGNRIDVGYLERWMRSSSRRLNGGNRPERLLITYFNLVDKREA
ncbi:TPA: hypothetical protein ACXN34_007897 [Burkholderia cepacia]